MTERDEMIEVIRNALWRQTFAREEDPALVERQKDTWPDDWDRTLPKAEAILLALEASGRRVVPVEATEGMKLAAGELIRQGSRKGEPLRPETIWGVFLAWAQYELSAAPGAPE